MSAAYGNVDDTDRTDMIIIRILPLLVVFCTVVSMIRIALIEKMTIGEILLRFCEPYVAGFFFLGIYCFIKRNKSIVKNRFPLFFFGIGPFLVAVAGYALGTYIMPEIFESVVFVNSDDALYGIAKTSVIIYLMMAGTIMVVHGVVSVVSAHFRQNISRVYHYIEGLKNDGTDDPKGRFTLKLYDVPDVIDIERIELDKIVGRRFEMSAFISMTTHIFLLGMVICSYFFLNPLFMKEMTIYETIMIGIMISFFIPVLIMPWYITRDTGTRIIGAARPFYLWKGLKKRMYQSFFAFTFVLFLVLITIYLESDTLRITYTYLGYVAFSIFLSIIYSYIFFSRYSIYVKEGIIKKFYD